jgi:hypothetical protein
MTRNLGSYLPRRRHDVVDDVLSLWIALVQAHGGNRRLAFRVLTD